MYLDILGLCTLGLARIHCAWIFEALGKKEKVVEQSGVRERRFNGLRENAYPKIQCRSKPCYKVAAIGGKYGEKTLVE